MGSSSHRHRVMLTLFLATVFGAQFTHAQLNSKRFFPQAAYGIPESDFSEDSDNQGQSFPAEGQFNRGNSLRRDSLKDHQQQGRFQEDDSFNVGKSFPGVVHTVLIPTENKGSAVANKASITNDAKSSSAIVTPTFGRKPLRNQDHLLNDPETDVPEFVSVLQVVAPLELLPPKQHVVGRRYPAVDPGPGFVFPPSQVNIFPPVNSNRL